MGLIVNESIEHPTMGISISGCYVKVSEIHIHKTPDNRFEVIGMIKIYGDKTAREMNKKCFNEHSTSTFSEEVPTNPYQLIFDELKKKYPDYTDVL
jgi:hypothetical protein